MWIDKPLIPPFFQNEEWALCKEVSRFLNNDRAQLKVWTDALPYNKPLRWLGGIPDSIPCCWELPRPWRLATHLALVDGILSDGYQCKIHACHKAKPVYQPETRWSSIWHATLISWLPFYALLDPSLKLRIPELLHLDYRRRTFVLQRRYVAGASAARSTVSFMLSA